MAYIPKRRGLGLASDPSFIASLANSIQRFEGWTPGSVAYRNNNPGNLRAGVGQSGTDSRGYAIFPDYTTGYAALEHQIQLNIDRGLTLDEFFGGKPGVYGGYAPSGDSNNPGQYAQTVAQWLGIDPETPLSAISSGGFTPVPAHPPATEQSLTADTAKKP